MPRFFKRYSLNHPIDLVYGPSYICLLTDCDLSWLRLFKFPQMDFEMAIWEMTSLLIAPKKVFKSMYYHVRNLCPFLRSEATLRIHC